MTLHWLKVFVVVAKHLNVTLASHELHVSQPAISQQLKRLQETVGARLIRRTRAGIELTAIGASFLTDVEAILTQLNGLTTKYASGNLESPKDDLVIGASHGVTASLLPGLMAQFAARYPAVDLRLFTDVSAEIENLILKSKVDIGVTMRPGQRAGLASEVFRSERLSAFAPAGHPLTKLKRIGVGELAKIPFVVITGRAVHSRAEKLLNNLFRSGRRTKISMRCESPEAVKTAVRRGAGVGILYYNSIQAEIRRNEFALVKLAGMELKVYKSRLDLTVS